MGIIAESLRDGVQNSSAHYIAAVELLANDKHGDWLDDKMFFSTCVYQVEDDDYPSVDWGAARAAFDNGVFDAASTTERAILDFAIALAEGRFKFHLMDDRQRNLIAAAAARAINPTVPPDLRF
ncbi:hypothetical protein [Nonomuraea sp. SBT364]|uniref:hypothetical protein n=1 Tax=Nonomuraea sp. SBT364 TaxID=1580530 RepID=UPI00066C7413|nr:hypothetical protein [Nonomuraea sp. SBT364]